MVRCNYLLGAHSGVKRARGSVVADVAVPYLLQQGHHALAPCGGVVDALHLEHVEDLVNGCG